MSLIHVLSIQILLKITDKQSYTESLTKFKILSASIRFSTIDKTVHNHHFISTQCNYTSLHKQISTSTTTPLQHLLLHIKFYEKQVSLTNKLQPLPCQFTSNITAHTFHFTHLNQPLKYTHYFHISKTQKNFTHS